MEAGGNWFVAWPVRLDESRFASWRAESPAGLRWFAPDDIHLTLAFLGRARPEKQAELATLLGVVPSVAPKVTLERLCLLPNPRRFSAVAFEMVGEPGELAALITAHRETFFRAAEAAPEVRPAHPHVTVARPERRLPPWQRRTIAKWAMESAVPSFSAQILPLAVFGWSRDRPSRQFQILAQARS